MPLDPMQTIFGYPACLTLDMNGEHMSVPLALCHDRHSGRALVIVNLDTVAKFIDEYNREHPHRNGDTWYNEGGYCG